MQLVLRMSAAHCSILLYPVVLEFSKAFLHKKFCYPSAHTVEMKIRQIPPSCSISHIVSRIVHCHSLVSSIR